MDFFAYIYISTDRTPGRRRLCCCGGGRLESTMTLFGRWDEERHPERGFRTVCIIIFSRSRCRWSAQ